jgi:hypothetical protein
MIMAKVEKPDNAEGYKECKMIELLYLGQTTLYSNL